MENTIFISNNKWRISTFQYQISNTCVWKWLIFKLRFSHRTQDRKRGRAPRNRLPLDPRRRAPQHQRPVKSVNRMWRLSTKWKRKTQDNGISLRVMISKIKKSLFLIFSNILIFLWQRPLKRHSYCYRFDRLTPENYGQDAIDRRSNSKANRPGLTTWPSLYYSLSHSLYPPWFPPVLVDGHAVCCFDVW